MRRAVFAGSFDPVTTGHIDIIERSASMFDELIVCIFHNVQKEGCFPLEERVRFLREATSHVPNVRVDVSSGLLTDYMKQEGARVVVRGLRSVKDFERYNLSADPPRSDLCQFFGRSGTDPLSRTGAGDRSVVSGTGDIEAVWKAPSRIMRRWVHRKRS